MKYYAVRKGKKTGIFLTWEETKKYVIGYPCAEYKSFSTLKLAEEYLNENKIQKKEEIIEEINFKIYTDGSSINYIGGYSFVYVTDKVEEFYGKVPGYCTNQRAELYAILRALQALSNVEGNIELYTDSQYSIDCLTRWYPNWIKNNWKNSKNQDVVNKELIQEILQVLKDLKNNIKFIHVYGHRGDKYNEICDELANLGRIM